MEINYFEYRNQRVDRNRLLIVLKDVFRALLMKRAYHSPKTQQERIKNNYQKFKENEEKPKKKMNKNDDVQ